MGGSCIWWTGLEIKLRFGELQYSQILRSEWPPRRAATSTARAACPQACHTTHTPAPPHVGLGVHQQKCTRVHGLATCHSSRERAVGAVPTHAHIPLTSHCNRIGGFGCIDGTHTLMQTDPTTLRPLDPLVRPTVRLSMFVRKITRE